PFFPCVPPTIALTNSQLSNMLTQTVSLSHTQTHTHTHTHTHNLITPPTQTHTHTHTHTQKSKQQKALEVSRKGRDQHEACTYWREALRILPARRSITSPCLF